jgi:hypothetical protein
MPRYLRTKPNLDPVIIGGSLFVGLDASLLPVYMATSPLLAPLSPTPSPTITNLGVGLYDHSHDPVSLLRSVSTIPHWSNVHHNGCREYEVSQKSMLMNLFCESVELCS